jgi:endo-1,4-beta-xylanase
MVCFRCACFAFVLFVIASAQSLADPYLAELAASRGVTVGAMILDPGWTTTAQRQLVANEFGDYGAATMGTYWSRTRPSATTYDWSLTDQAVAWAASEGMKIHLHPLLFVADNQNPSWVTSSAPTAANANGYLADHITTAVTRYKAGSVRNPTSSIVWDVVNEAVAPDGGFRGNWWLTALGPSVSGGVPQYIIKAFELARAADPSAILLYNDHDIELSNGYQTGKWNRVKQIVQELFSRGLIDGLGWQLHTNPSEVLGTSLALEERMAWVKSLGLKNFVTELDMELTLNESLETQADAYRKVTDIWLRQNNGGYLQVWGVSDQYSWLNANSSFDKRPLLFDNNLNRKPAYYGVQAALLAVPENSAFVLVGAALVLGLLSRMGYPRQQ